MGIFVGMSSDSGSTLQGLMKVYTNQTNALEESTAVMEHKDKDQETRLELAELFI
jgi:hypothetical protein